MCGWRVLSLKGFISVKRDMETANKPLMISIVTASFNQGPYIRQAIQSVLDQGAGHVEHLIVDNCSSDDTPAIIGQP